jgi:hypothetical protein
MKDDPWEENSWLAAGMAGASFVAVTQLATRSDLNFMHKAAIALFALCLPCLVMGAMTWRNPPKNAFEQRVAELTDDVFLIAMLCFCIAIACLFASFGFVYAIVFVLGFSPLIWITKGLSKSDHRSGGKGEREAPESSRDDHGTASGS